MALRRQFIKILILAALGLGIAVSAPGQPGGTNAAAQKEIDDASALLDVGGKEAYEKAIAKLDHALQLLGKDGNASQSGEAYFIRASCKIALAQDAIPDLQKFIDLSPDNPSNLFLGNSFTASEYAKRGNDAAARPYLDRVWELLQDGSFEKLDADAMRSDVGLKMMAVVGEAFIRLKERKKALDVLWRSFLVQDKVSEDRAIDALEVYAMALVTLGTPRDAIPHLEAALKRAVAAKLSFREAEVSDAIGGVYLYHLDELANAGPYLTRALQIAEELKSDELLYRTLNDAAQFQYRDVNFALALKYYDRALALADSAGAPAGDRSSILYNMSQMYLGIGENDKADAALARALELSKNGQNPLIEGSVIIGQLLRRLDKGEVVDPKAVVAECNRAAELVKDLPYGQKSIAEWMQSLGMWALSHGAAKESVPLFQQALAHARSWGFRLEEGMTLANLGIAQNILGDHRSAVENFNASLAIFRSLGIRAQEGRSLEHLMWTWSKLGNPSLAIFFGKSAVNIYQGFRKETADLSADQREALMGKFEDTYRELARILIEQGRLAEAEGVLTMLKQQEVIDFVRRDDNVAKQMLATLPVSDEERAAITRYQDLADKITAVGQEFDALEQERKQSGAGAFPKQQRYDELKQQLADASLTFQKFLDELKLKFGQKDTRVAEVDSSLKTTLRTMKADRTAVVSTIVGEDSLSIIVTTSRTQRAHTLPIGAKRLNDLVAKFREGLTSPKYDPRPVAQQLYDVLVKPIETDLAGINADTIVWSLDGTLRYMPPAALWDKDKGYLAERFANVIINLASRDKIKDLRAKDALSVLGVGVSKPVDGFAPLVAVPDELDCIVEDRAAGILSAKPECKTGVLSGRKLLDDKFTLASFEGELGRYPIVHVATHFKLTPGDDKNSFILLGGGADRKFTIDRLRTEQSLADVELIVLSACNTATPGGEKANGVEIEGFGSVAQEEGAKAVMASLWPVADASTKDLMVEFYRLYGKEGRSKAQAIRAAQLKLLRGSYPADTASTSRGVPFSSDGSSLPIYKADPKAPFAHPFYWSPFVLIGNWQ